VEGGLHKPAGVNAVYNPDWEDEPECQGWLMRSASGGARCVVCNVELPLKLAELKRHGRSQKHLRNMTALWDRVGLGSGDDLDDDLKPPFQAWQLPEIKKRDFELKAALVMGLDAGFRGAKEMCGVLEDRLGLDAFSMTSRQAKALFKLVLAPYFKNYLKSDMRQACFSLVLDAAANVLPSGQIGVCIYYFSRNQQRTVATYLGLLKLDREDVLATVDSLGALLNMWELNPENLVSIVADGVAELFPDKMESFFDTLKENCPNVLNLHSSFSALSHAFHAAVKKSLPPAVEFMLRESYNWFADGLQRQYGHKAILEQVGFLKPESVNEEERQRQEQAEEAAEQEARVHRTRRAEKRRKMREAKVKDEPREEDENFEEDVIAPASIAERAEEGPSAFNRISPDASQWLRVADYTTGLFLHFDALKVHFEKAAKEEKCYTAHLLHKEFSDEHNRLFFTVLQPMLTEISDLKVQLANLAATGALDVEVEGEDGGLRDLSAIGVGAGLCEHIESLFLSLASQILEPEALANKSVEEMCAIDALDETNEGVLSVDEVIYGPNFTTILEASTLPAEDKKAVKLASATFLRELFAGLQKVLKNALMLMRCVEHFTLPHFLNNELESKHLAEPFYGQDEESQELVLGKYRLMKMLDWKSRRSTLSFWQEVHEFGDPSGNFPLRPLSDGVWRMFVVPLFNQEITRVQSAVNRARRGLRAAKVEEDLAESILVCRFGLRRLNKDSSQFQPPAELIKDTNA